MIFEDFATVHDAAAFITKVQELHPELHCQMFTDSESAGEHDVFPSVQEPIVVHVDRVADKGQSIDDLVAAEEAIERLADEFTGVFVGT
jgi:hypothetical protein